MPIIVPSEMFDTPEQSLRELKNLGLPEVFVEMWTGGGPARFRRQFDVPTRFFQVKKALKEANPEIEGYIPILELNKEAIYAYDATNRHFVEYYYGDTKATVIGRNYQQFIGSLFVELGFAGLETLVIEVAQEFDFRFVEALKLFLDQVDEVDAAEAKRRFVSGLR